MNGINFVEEEVQHKKVPDDKNIGHSPARFFGGKQVLNTYAR